MLCKNVIALSNDKIVFEFNVVRILLKMTCESKKKYFILLSNRLQESKRALTQQSTVNRKRRTQVTSTIWFMKINIVIIIHYISAALVV